MNGMQMMQQPKEKEWSEIAAELKVSIVNSEKNLLMAKAQLKEAESHIKEE